MTPVQRWRALSPACRLCCPSNGAGWLLPTERMRPRRGVHGAEFTAVDAPTNAGNPTARRSTWNIGIQTESGIFPTHRARLSVDGLRKLRREAGKSAF